jgi:hypothetical protein
MKKSRLLRMISVTIAVWALLISPVAMGVLIVDGGTTYTLVSPDSLTEDDEYIGYDTTGVFDHISSTNTMNYLYVGHNAGSSGTYNLSSGSVSASVGKYHSAYIGNFGTGLFSQSGGTHSVGNIYLGHYYGSSGAYNLDGGILSTNYETIGRLGSGIFTQTGGEHTVAGDTVVGGYSTGVYTQSGGTNTISRFLYLGRYSGSSGMYTLSDTASLSADTEYIGHSGTGTFIQSGGSHEISNYLRIGYSSGINGTYTLNSGDLSVSHELIGDSGAGTFTQLGGTHVASTLGIGNNSDSSGVYNLRGGALTATTEIIGNGGSGIFNQTGGTHISKRLYLGYGSSGNGVYELTDGSLSVVGYSSGDGYGYIGYSGAGRFIQTGGSHSLRRLYLSATSGGSGTYELSGGELSIYDYYGSGHEYIGFYDGSNAVFTQSGGTHDVSENLYVGYGYQSNANYDLYAGDLSAGNLMIGYLGSYGAMTQSGGTNTVHNNLYMGSSSGDGTYDQSEGILFVNNNEYLGMTGLSSGIFNQSGGEHTVTNDLYLGQWTGAGTYNLSAGSLSTSNEFIGNESASGTGTFNQSGGAHTVSNTMTIVAKTGGTSVYNLQGGTLDASTIQVNTGGVFNFNGGKLIVENFIGSLVNAGGTLAPGDSPGTTMITGDYTQMLDGIFEVEIGGLLQGTEYDWLDVGGTATLGGTLDVSLFDIGTGLFEPSLGDSFDILTADTIEGEFDILTLALLGDGLKWDLNYILDDSGTDFVRLSVSQVPIPAAVWLFGSGLIGLLGIARRKKS